MLPFLLAFTFTTIQRWVTTRGFTGGVIVIFCLLFACGLGLPLPEDVPLLLAGYFIAQAKMNPVIAAVVAWLGIIGGDCMLYRFGKKYGLNITKVPFIGKHVTKGRILRAEQLFEGWGVWVVAVGRLFAGIRGAMVVAAGAIRFNFFKFVIADGLAALVSGGMFMALGYWAGVKLGSLDDMRKRIQGVEHLVFGGIALVVVLFALFIWIRRRRHKPPVMDIALDRAAERAAHHVRHSDADGNGEVTGEMSDTRK